MEWMILPLKRYAQFSGRSQRKEYWMFVLFSFLVSLVLSILDRALGLGGSANSFATATPGTVSAGAAFSGRGVLSSLWSLGVLIPSLAVTVRRLHDIDRTGWWVAVLFGLFVVGFGSLIATMVNAMANGGTPSVGLSFGMIVFIAAGIMSIVMLVWACTDGTRGANRFGPDPKGSMADLRETFR